MFDRAFDALGHVQRRRLLVALLERNSREDPPIQPEDVIIDDEERERSLVLFHHVHLPKLAEGGYIDWDREAYEITKGPRFDEIRPVLKLLHNHADELPGDWV